MNAARPIAALVLLAAAWISGGCLGKNMGDGIYLSGTPTDHEAIKATGLEEVLLSGGRRISRSWSALVQSGAVPYGWKPVTVWVDLLPNGQFGPGTISNPEQPSEKIRTLVEKTIQGAQAGAKPLSGQHSKGVRWQVILDVP